MLLDNALGLQSMEELITWTTSYFHFKQALEAVTLTPEQAQTYLAAFEPFCERLRTDLHKQSILEANLPKPMREQIAAEKPHLALIQRLLNTEASTTRRNSHTS